MFDSAKALWKILTRPPGTSPKSFIESVNEDMYQGSEDPVYDVGKYNETLDWPWQHINDK